MRTQVCDNRHMATAAQRPRRTQRERVEESTRRLAVAAVELFGEQGFERTTAAQIGERAGYSRAMVRRRYGSKEELLAQVVEQEFATRITPPPGDERPGRERILAQVDRLIDFLEEDEAVAKAFFVLTFETAGPIPSLRPWYRDWFASYEAQMRETLHDGQRDGSIRADLDDDVEAKAFVSYGLGLAFRKTLDWDGYDYPGEARAWQASLARRYAP
jgi:AcrR family transcriptional regulator